MSTKKKRKKNCGYIPLRRRHCFRRLSRQKRQSPAGPGPADAPIRPPVLYRDSDTTIRHQGNGSACSRGDRNPPPMRAATTNTRQCTSRVDDVARVAEHVHLVERLADGVVWRWICDPEDKMLGWDRFRRRITGRLWRASDEVDYQSRHERRFRRGVIGKCQRVREKRQGRREKRFKSCEHHTSVGH